jgi:glycosyltransferase involved in cell wall biosynthesis
MKLKVALVYDRVNTPYGGAEKVLLALNRAFPEAPLYTSVYHPRAKWASVFEIKTSFLQKIPFANKLHRFLVPLMPLAFESFDFSEYDIVISITSAEAKGIITQPHQLHLCYLLTPTRYLYSHRDHYEQTHWPFKIPVLRFLSRKIFDYLTWWDKVAAQRPDIIIPISNLVKSRAEEHYQRQLEETIYPPFDPEELEPNKDVENFAPYYLPKEYLLVISRLVPYKRIDLAIQACQRLNKSLVIIGEGPAAAQLKKISSSKVHFLGNVTTTQRQAIIDQSQAVIMPGLEDFGITAIEIILSSKPIILHAKSGASELIKDEPGAILLKRLSISELTTAIKKSNKLKLPNASLKKKFSKYAINDFTALFKSTAVEFYNTKREGYS